MLLNYFKPSKQTFILYFMGKISLKYRPEQLKISFYKNAIQLKFKI